MNIFFPRRMKDLTIIVHDDNLEDVVESLHELGKVEISSVDRDTEVSELISPGSLPEIARTLTDLEMQISGMLDVFSELPEEDESLMDMLRPEPVVPIYREQKEPEVLMKEVQETLEDSGKKIQSIDGKINDIDSRLTEMDTLLEDLEFLGDIDVDLRNMGESDYTVVRMGRTKDPLGLKKALSKIKSSFLHMEPRGEDEYAYVAGAYIRDKDEFDAALRHSDSKYMDFPSMEGTPAKVLLKIKLNIKELKDQKDKFLNQLVKLRNRYSMQYRALKEELEILGDKIEVQQQLGRTKSTGVIKAWCPKDDVAHVRTVVEKSSRGCAVVTDGEPDDPDMVPVSLENPTMIRPFEMLTNMFAPPRYNEVDPTMILAPAFVIFFGLMLSDAVYGAVVTATALLMLWGPARTDKGIKDFGWILLAAGISTIIFGIVQGGYMGPESADYLNLPGYLGLSSPALLNTLEGEGPLNLLIISLIIGLVYMNIGMVLSLVQHITRKNYRDILYENVSWWLLQPGGFILVGGQMFGWFDFSSTVVMLAWIMAGVGLILLLIRARGLAFFELTGFIGDFLSFARILALALATAGIALTVNVLTNLVGSAEIGMIVALPVLIAGVVMLAKGGISHKKRFMAPGIFLAIAGGLGMVSPVYMFYIFALVVLLSGHLINLVLQALGSFVHSLRLQYVEFFGYFYEGGGTTFKPFKPERIYTKKTSNEEVME